MRTSVVEEAWRTAAERVDGITVRSAASGFPAIEVEMPPTRALFDVVMGEYGHRTRGRIPFWSGAPANFAVSPEGFFTRLLKPLGFIQDIELGVPRFDAMYRVKGFREARVKELLDSPVHDLLIEHPGLRLWTAPPWTVHLDLPAGVHFLEVVSQSVVVDPDRLVGMVEILRAIVPRLDPVGTPSAAETDDVGELVKRVMRAGGSVFDPWVRGARWELDPPRREAIRELGVRGGPDAVPTLMAVLGDEDPELLADAIEALLRLDDRRCVPALVRTLGELSKLESGVRVADGAAAALRHFGEGELADAVLGTIDRGVGEFGPHLGHYRSEIVHALMEVGSSFDLEARVHAVRALGEIGAREALPLLRDASKSMGMRTKYSTAAREAIRAIEARASLPKAAGGVSEDDRPDTLPRPAADAETSSRDRLPRAADSDAD